MKIYILLCAITIMTLSFKIQSPSEPTSLNAKIPEYIGLGYHLLLGNPLTNHVDEGFRAPIFNFSYSKNQRTEDDKYLIPDYTHSSQTISCSLQSKVNEYTGTKNYQKQLETITKIDTKLSMGFIEAAFSFSRTFSQFSNSTQTHKQTSYQSNAQCTVYTLSMPVFSNQISLSQDFTQGVKRSYEQQNWEQFINHFGTHYASTVVFGGRYLLQHTYSQQSMSLFTSMKLDIQLAAKVQYYNKIGVNFTDQVKKYQNQTNFVNTKIQAERLSTLGGLPPRSGNWIDWEQTVKDNLAPVSYYLTTTSQLFGFIKGIDNAGAIKSYNSYLNSYCLRNKCPPLTPDRPAPKPLAINFGKLPQISGTSKSSHTYDTNDGNIKVGMRVNKVLLGSQGSIDSIQFFLSDGINQHALPVTGNRGFNHQYDVPKADEINCIRFGITYNLPFWKFTSMQFVTKRGVQSQVYAGSYNINEYRILCLENIQQHFIGFYGHYGNTFDSIGFNYMKQTIQK